MQTADYNANIDKSKNRISVPRNRLVCSQSYRDCSNTRALCEVLTTLIHMFAFRTSYNASETILTVLARLPGEYPAPPTIHPLTCIFGRPPAMVFIHFGKTVCHTAQLGNMQGRSALGRIMHQTVALSLGCWSLRAGRSTTTNERSHSKRIGSGESSCLQ